MGCRGLKSVVLIDDDLDFIEYLSNLVVYHSEYHVVGSAQSGREAMLVIDHFRPDLIIMDIMLPDNDGLTVINYIRKKCGSYNPYIYVITAMATPTIRTILKELKVDFRSFKPIENELIISKILEHVNNLEPKSLLQNSQPILKNPVDVIIDIIDELKIPQHLVGNEYIKTALIFMWDDPILKRNVYAKVATVFNGATSRGVASNINNAIKACMSSEMYLAEFGKEKVETLLFLNHLSAIVKKRMRGSDIN